MDILKAPCTRPTDSAVIFNNITNLLPNINTNVKRFLKNQTGKLPVRRHSSAELSFSDEVPLIEVTPPSPRASRKTTFDIEFNKVILDTLDVCKRKIRRFSEPCLSNQLNLADLEKHAERARRRSMPCISSKHLLKVPKPTKNKKQKRRLSLPINPRQSDLPDFSPLEKSLTGSYEKIHYYQNDNGDPPTTVHEIFIPGFGNNKNSETEMSWNQNRKSGDICHPVSSASLKANEQSMTLTADKETNDNSKYQTSDHLENRDKKSGKRDSKIENLSSETVTSPTTLLCVTDRNLNKLSKRQGVRSLTTKELNSIHSYLINDINDINGIINDDIAFKGQIIDKNSTPDRHLSRLISPTQSENTKSRSVNGGLNEKPSCANRHSVSRLSKTLEKKKETLVLDNRGTTHNKSDHKQKELPTNLIKTSPLKARHLKEERSSQQKSLTEGQNKAVLEVYTKDSNNRLIENQQHKLVNLERCTTIVQKGVPKELESPSKNRVQGCDLLYKEKKILTVYNTSLKNSEETVLEEVKRDFELSGISFNRLSSYEKQIEVCGKSVRRENDTNCVTLNSIGGEQQSDENRYRSLSRVTQHNKGDHCNLHVSQPRSKSKKSHKTTLDSFEIDFFSREIETKKSNYLSDVNEVISVIKNNEQVVTLTMKSSLLLNSNVDELCNDSKQLICVDDENKEKQTERISTNEELFDLKDSNTEMGPTRHFSDVISDVLSGKSADVATNLLMTFNGIVGTNGKVVYDAKSEDCNVFVETTTTEHSMSSDSSEGELDGIQEMDENGKLALMKSTSLTGLDTFVTKRPQIQLEARPVSLHVDSISDQKLIGALSSSANEDAGTKPRDEKKPTSKSLEELIDGGGENGPNANRAPALNRLNKDFANAMMRKAVSLVEIQNEKLKENVARWEKKFLSTEVLSAPEKDWFPRVSMEDCSSCASCRSRSSSYHNLLYDFDTASQFPIYQPTVIDYEEDAEAIFDGTLSSSLTTDVPCSDGSQSSSGSVEDVDANEENELEKTVTNNKIENNVLPVEEPAEEDSKTKMLKYLKKERFMKQSQAAFGSLKDKFRKVKGKM